MNTASPQASPAVVFRDVVTVYNGRVTALDHVSFEAVAGSAGQGWNAAAGRPLGMSHVAALAAWTVGLGAMAAWRWPRERRRLIRP
jgi:hypothetical protein